LRTKKGKNCKRREELNVFIFTLYFWQSKEICLWYEAMSFQF
jgi:hypothetical protein